MNGIRGIIMLVVAALAFWKAWALHGSTRGWLGLGLGVLALAMAVWHFTRKNEARPR